MSFFVLAWLALLNGTTEAGLSQVPSRLAGRVLLPDGTPAADVPVLLFWHQSHAKTVTDDKGKFVLDVQADQLNRTFGDDWHRMALASTAPNCGAGWTTLGRISNATDVTLQLAEDQAVRGKVLNQQGQPVPGATITVLNLHRAVDENLDGFLKVSRDRPTELWLHARDVMVYLSPEAVLQLQDDRNHERPTATTDENGQFAFHGFGKERSLYVTVSGPGIRTETLYIVTRPRLDARWKRAQPSRQTLLKLESGATMPAVYPAQFYHLAGPSQTVSGRLTDAGTGEPVQGMHLSARIRGSSGGATAVSDAQGRYELTGLAPEGTLQVTILNRTNLPYLDARILRQISATKPPGPIDFKLDRGIRITGTVTDQADGHTVAGRVGYLAWQGNDELLSLHQPYDAYVPVRTDEDGSYAIVVPAGPGVLSFAADSRSDYDFAAAADFGFPTTDSGHFQSANRGYVRSTEFHFLKRIEPTSKASAIEIPIEVGRGAVYRVQLVKPDGSRFEEVIARNVVPRLRRRYVGGLLTVTGLQPDQTRTLLAYSPDRKHAGIIRLLMPANSADQQQTTVLPAAGSLSGRLTDPQGRPQARWKVAAMTAGALNTGNARRRPTDTFVFADSSTDADGYFRLTGIPAGIAVDINAADDSTDRRTPPQNVTTVTLRPNQRQDLGARSIEP